MYIGGLQKFSLIDYPGLISAVIFTQGCNFRCPYCHNPQLVFPELFEESLNEESVLEFLKSREGQLDGVVITGGEPALQPDLLPFLKTIKAMSFQVKLDTNGSRPDVIEKALKGHLVNFIAMDIKAPLKNYSEICGVRVDTEAIATSIQHVLDSDIAYQFRTTVDSALMSREMADCLRQWMKNLHARHIFQRCRKREAIRDSVNK